MATWPMIGLRKPMYLRDLMTYLMGGWPVYWPMPAYAGPGLRWDTFGTVRS